MKSFIKVWWHCLWRINRDLNKDSHRMITTYYKGEVCRSCSCEYNLIENHLDIDIGICNKEISRIWWQ